MLTDLRILYLVAFDNQSGHSQKYTIGKDAACARTTEQDSSIAAASVVARCFSKNAAAAVVAFPASVAMKIR